MRIVKLVCAATLVAILISCGDSQGGGLDFNPDDGGVIGSGIDPGKGASTCYPAFADNELNVATWNIERFSASRTDFSKVRSIVNDLDADIIAIQEINSLSDFTSLANGLPDWTGYAMDIGGQPDLGFLVKSDAFLEIGSVYNAVDLWPRDALAIDVKHASGLEVTLINIHLKCCGDPDEVEAREESSIDLKGYIDSNLSTKAVILLGDFNDDITENDTPFDNFLDDPGNYRFADMGIALGSSTNFSYPSWPSHIDHILITDELFGKVGLVQTIKPESCVSNYSYVVSDHRPVLASFK